METSSSPNTVYIDSGVSKAIGGRDHQEDSFNIMENALEKQGFALYSVFDGHGCSDLSKHASVHMKDFVVGDENFRKKNYPDALRRAFNNENQALLKVFEKHSGGTTATVVLIADGVLYCANVGDSRCVLARKDKQGYTALRCSRDHSFKDKQERTRVIEGGGDVDGNRVYTRGHGINMTRALGDFDFKTPYNQAKDDWISAIPDIRSIKLTPDLDFLVLASDGLWTVMDDEVVVDEVVKLKNEGLTAQEISEKIVDRISHVPRSDNITVIIVDFSWDKTPTKRPGIEIHTVHKPVELSG
jgi:serine/threonine protein phosphatase PrpC